MKLHPSDTTCLYLRSVLYLSLNKIEVNPDLGSKITFDNLVIAKKMTEKAANLKMQNFYLRVLRAEIYKELTYRLAGDKSWKLNSQQISERRNWFNDYKHLANQYYDELALLDKRNAYDYIKLKVMINYPN